MQQESTILLKKAVEGDERAVDELFSVLYGDLRVRARQQRRKWHGNLTLNTTAIVHEAYVKLADQTRPSWRDRAHFVALASRAMRHVLIDYARKVDSEKRGGGVPKQSMEDAERIPIAMDAPLAHELIDLERALQGLESENPMAARVVECRFFGGMTVEETAVALDISTPTVKRRWALARAWMYTSMGAGG